MQSPVWKRETTATDSLFVDFFDSFNPSTPSSDLNRSIPTIRKSTKTAEKHVQKGISFYTTGSYIDALDEFNTAIQYVEAASTDVHADIIIRRSECFRLLKLYDRAAADGNTAKQISPKANVNPHRDELMSKEQQKTAHVHDPLVSTVNYRGLGACLQIHNDDTFGRQVLATSDINVGEVVINEQILFHATTKTNARCSYCFKDRQNFVACADCADVLFCDETCAKNDEIHRMLCQTVFHSLDLQYKIQVYAILRTMQIFDNVAELEGFIDAIRMEKPEYLPPAVKDAQSMYHFYLKLKYRNEFKEDTQFIIWNVFAFLMELPSIATKFDTPQKRRFLQHLIGLHCLINATNGFTDGHNRWISILTSMVNHSCAPNALWMNINNRSICVIIRPIQRGEQMFINYIGNVNGSRQERRNILLSTWGFSCQCDRCECMGKKNILALMNDVDFKQIGLFRCRGYQEREQRNTLKMNCENVLARFGRNAWSFELGTVLTAYTTILLLELRSFYWRNSNEGF